MSISTRLGDEGTTSVIGEKRYPKDHPLVECLGTLDELNAFLGDAKAAIAASENPSQNLNYPHNAAHSREIISAIQKELFVVSGILAGSGSNSPDVKILDAYITNLEADLGAFTGFAIPGENPSSAKLHIARTVCRRTERCMVGLCRTNTIHPETQRCLFAWINRLSDLLFLLAQKEAAIEST